MATLVAHDKAGFTESGGKSHYLVHNFADVAVLVVGSYGCFNLIEVLFVKKGRSLSM